LHVPSGVTTMGQENDILVEEAKDAIALVFSDRSVAVSETRENLGDLISDIKIMLQTLPE